MSPLTITPRSVGEVAILALSGHLVAGGGTHPLRAAVKAAVDGGTRALLLDLEDLSYVDSAGVGMLVEIYRHVTRRGGQVKLLHPSLCARRVLGITHLTCVFEVFDNEAEALLNLAGTDSRFAPK
jgi:anti-sigma B factor antagonist